MIGFLQAREKILAASLIIIFFLLNLSIASRSPFGAWQDEVTYTDPGLNLAVGKGWTSSVWPWETDREFYADNSPLYPAGLSLWVRVFGISMVSARAYCYSLAAIGMLLLWLGTFRFQLLTPAYRLFWIVILSTEYGMNWMERNERYDVWIFVGLALAWFGASLRNPPAKYPLIFAGCFLVPFAGFIGVPYIFLAAGLVIVLTRFKFWKEAVTGMAGAGFGVVGVALFFLVFGKLQTFWACLHKLTASEQIMNHPAFQVFLYPLDDMGMVVMIGLLAVLSFYSWKYPSPCSLAWLGLGWGMVLLMPCVMLMRGLFIMMYFYMLIIPLSLAILQLARQAADGARGRYMAVAVTLVMGMLCLGGLPARLYTSWTNWDFRDPQHMRDFVRTYVHPDDAVFADYPFYFELRDYAKFVAMPHYLWIIPPDEARQITVALVGDRAMPDLTRDASGMLGIGGGWKKVAVFPTPEMEAKLKGAPKHDTFTLYRREAPSP
ncbi:MAG TPA: hypothetical protein VGZ93_08030 [Candidatus Methylacidiphilales bacterium]|nr:hypothetical protein [Candidatus Methylacidiphilales bacterium]